MYTWMRGLNPVYSVYYDSVNVHTNKEVSIVCYFVTFGNSLNVQVLI